jgi:probable phosphoglycerate mutase
VSTVFLLVRHATNDFVGKAIAGRAPGVKLNEAGRRQADALAARLSSAPVAAIYVSPLERTHETAEPLATRLNLTPRVLTAIHEIDCGEWTGKTFQELDRDPEWRVWVTRRTQARPPNGETIVEAQQRAVDAIMRLRAQHEGETIVLVSHGDVIKAALAHFLRISLDDLETFDIAPVSVSAIHAGADWAQVKLVNDTGALPTP